MMLQSEYSRIFITVVLLLIFAPQIKTHKNLNECNQCKKYTDSFKYWYDKTSRGKFEGGDAAWEESKLKSYSRSEIRLVEIQENLCSDLKQHKDACYAVAEQAETLIEKWWLEESHESSDLHYWLCIDNLKFCCPKNTYGDKCTPCPEINNKICSGHGVCKGEGTRKGDGSCSCNAGYTGEHCDQCEINYFSADGDKCEPCHEACKECFSYGPDRCKVCATGWKLNDSACIDINECTTLSPCKSNEFCINNIGSYKCIPCDKSCNTCTGMGPYNCTTCKPNDILWSGKCMDDKTSKIHLASADKRLFLYVTLNILMYLFYQKAKPLAVVMGATLSILIFKLESVSDVTVIDTIQTHIIDFLRANELL